MWRANDLVIEGTGPDANAVVTDKTCMGKAIFVIAGNDTTVRNLTLARARVPDMNGAGIRLEGRNLTVEAVKFVNNQEGILGGGPGSRMIVRDSQFLQNGTCAAACAHGIYAGGDLLRVEHSRFFETRQGHHIKSRALRTEVIGCDIEDGKNGTSSYLIETPNGGSLLVRDNIPEKGPRSENHGAAISIGTEGVTHPTPEIIIENNKFTNDGEYPSVFVRNLTATPAVLRVISCRVKSPPWRGMGAWNKAARRSGSNATLVPRLSKFALGGQQNRSERQPAVAFLKLGSNGSTECVELLASSTVAAMRRSIVLCSDG